MNGNKDFRLGVSEIPKPVHLATTDLRSASGMLTRFREADRPLGESHQYQAVAETNQREVPPSNAATSWFILSCLVIYGVVCVTLIYSDKILNYFNNTFVPNSKIPCSTCRFFNDNFYLKCAVRPCAALTEEAIDCSDYYPCNDVSEKDLLR